MVQPRPVTPPPPSPLPPPPPSLRRRRPWHVVGWVLLACAGGVGFLYVGASFFGAVFISEFSLVNDSGEDLRVTPIGVSEGPGWTMPLPRVHRRWTPLMRVRGQRLLLPADQSRSILYDWDDVNFRHVLVEDTRGNVYLMDTDKKGNLDFCYANQQDEYRVPPLSKLPRAPAELLPLLEGKWVHYSGAKEYEKARFLH